MEVDGKVVMGGHIFENLDTVEGRLLRLEVVVLLSTLVLVLYGSTQRRSSDRLLRGVMSRRPSPFHSRHSPAPSLDLIPPIRPYLQPEDYAYPSSSLPLPVESGHPSARGGYLAHHARGRAIDRRRRRRARRRGTRVHQNSCHDHRASEGSRAPATENTRPWLPKLPCCSSRQVYDAAGACNNAVNYGPNGYGGCGGGGRYQNEKKAKCVLKLLIPESEASCLGSVFLNGRFQQAQKPHEASASMSSASTGSTPAMFNAARFMSSKLFVGGLSWRTDDTSVRDAFSSFGEATEARVITDRETEKSRGFGFVNFADEESAKATAASMVVRMAMIFCYKMATIFLP